MSKPYIIGTRGSLLALTQCKQIKKEIEEKTGETFELKIIKTQGDLVTDKALWQLEGKDFFTKELDAALLKGEVDLVVHSYKDLGSERPAGIQLASVTKRHLGHDILLARKIDHKKENYLIGTSSPRRISNALHSLKNFLPISETTRIETDILRGNVNTRIEKLKSGKYDAIILAMAGLERLALGQEEILKELLNDLNFMILPQSQFPSAASQGALAIECLKGRKDNDKLLNILKSVEDHKTSIEIQRERAAFKKYGGGCHLAVGIQVSKVECGFIHVHKGEVDQKRIDQHFLERTQELPLIKDQKSPIFLGLPKKEEKERMIFDSCLKKEEIHIDIPSQNQNFVLASRYGIETVKELYDKGHYIWSSGASTWQRLAKQGIWVNGSCDSLGEEEIIKLKNSKVVALMQSGVKKWSLLSNDKTTTQLDELIPIYKKEFRPPNQELINQLKDVEMFYWTSYDQYQKYTDHIPDIKNKTHCCGVGKTLAQFKNKNIEINPFSTMDEFYHWVKLEG